MVSFNDLGLEFKNKSVSMNINGNTVNVRGYLPIKEKEEFVKFVVNAAIDDATGCFSPIRVEVYYSIGLCKWYSDIQFDDNFLENICDIYDLLDSNGIISSIVGNIPSEELRFMYDLIDDTVKDIARYNNSAAGMIQAMSSNSKELSTQIQEIMSKIQHKEGLESVSSFINDIYG